MKKNGLLILSLLVMLNTMGQGGGIKRGHYFISQVALLNGDHSASGQVQFAGGVEKHNWAFGIGTAIDYYKVRTVPVFADGRFFWGKKRSFFSYANLGANLAWALESQYRNYWLPGGTSQKSSFSNGLYTDLGIGYALSGIRSKGVIISVGYSIKTLTETYYQFVYRDFPPYGGENSEHRLTYQFNRISLKLGYSF